MFWEYKQNVALISTLFAKYVFDKELSDGVQEYIPQSAPIIVYNIIIHLG